MQPRPPLVGLRHPGPLLVGLRHPGPPLVELPTPWTPLVGLRYPGPPLVGLRHRESTGFITAGHEPAGDTGDPSGPGRGDLDPATGAKDDLRAPGVQGQEQRPDILAQLEVIDVRAQRKGVSALDIQAAVIDWTWNKESSKYIFE